MLGLHQGLEAQQLLDDGVGEENGKGRQHLAWSEQCTKSRREGRDHRMLNGMKHRSWGIMSDRPGGTVHRIMVRYVNRMEDAFDRENGCGIRRSVSMLLSHVRQTCHPVGC